MNITVNTKDLQQALTLTRCVRTNSKTFPILGYIHLRVNKNSLYLRATDIDNTLTVQVAAGNTSEGVCLVSHDEFYMVMRSAKSEMVSLACASNSLVIKAGGSTYTLETYANLDDFPKEQGSDEDYDTVESSALAEHIAAVAYAASEDSSRTNLCGINLKCSDGTLRMCATDGHRLSVTETRVQGAASFDVILYANALDVISAYAEDNTFSIGVGKTFARICTRKTTRVRFVLYTKLIDYQFPHYEQLLPKDGPRARVEVPTKDLLVAVKAAKAARARRTQGAWLIAVAETFLVKVISENAALEKATPKDLMKNQPTDLYSTELQADIQGKPVYEILDPDYVLDVLNSYPKKGNTVISFWSDTSPVKFSGRSDGFAIIMPIRKG